MDIFLPICGEPIEVLRNTWMGVFELIQAYPGLTHAYVLDDGPSDEADRRYAPIFGFTYVRRPNLRDHKKAGNLNYALRRAPAASTSSSSTPTSGRAPDFLAETLPYMDDPAVGIVQTPQFFRVSPRQTWVERAAGPTLEVFYRAVQVSRDRFGSALCVGSNAVYRRAALDAAGRIHRDPLRRGLAHRPGHALHGYELAYVPVPLAAGICPADARRVHAPAVPVVLRRDLAGLDASHVAGPDAVARPAALHRRLALEPHHRAAHPDPAADPDHAAGLPAGRNPASQRAPAASRR